MKISLLSCFSHTFCGLACLVGAATAGAEDTSFKFVGDDTAAVVESSAHTADKGEAFVFVEEATASPISVSPEVQDNSWTIVSSEEPVKKTAPSPQGDIKLVSDESYRPALFNSEADPEVTRSGMPKQAIPRTAMRTVARPQTAAKLKVSKPAPLDTVGQLLVDAHTASQTAATTTDFSEVIDVAVEAIRLGAKSENKQFANQLISWALNRRGQLYSGDGKTDLADADFEESLKFDRKNWRAMHNRGVSYAESGQFAEAFDDFNLVLELNPLFAKAYTNRATLFVQAGDLNGAEQDYKQACRLDSKLSSARLGLARVCHIGGRWEEAYTHFTAAAKLDPGNAGILCSRGDLLADMGHYAEALADYAEAIEIKPSFAHAYRNGAWLLATCPDENFRDPENAVLGARQALEFEYGDKHVALDTLAAALANAGDYDEAIKTLETAVETAPSALRNDYVTRIKMYESRTPYRTQPVAVVSQAFYEDE